MKIKLIISLCTILCWAQTAWCFNHPEIKWKSVTTDHFVIHYYDKTEAAVYPAWKIAEEQYASLSALYDYRGRGAINLALADYDDYSNGFAGWTNGSILIWVIDSRFDLRASNTWMQNVITHELAHIMTLEKESSPQLLSWSLSLSYQSPHSNLSFGEPFATTMFWPSWLAEGIAQRESNRAGNDCFDSRRAMIQRDALVFSKPLSLEEMGHFNHTSVGNEMVYNQGFSFVTFLENQLGFSALKGLFNDGRGTMFWGQDFYSYFQARTGRSITKLYEQWRDSAAIACKLQIPQSPTQTKTLWAGGCYNSMPKATADGRFIGWLSSDKDDYNRTDLLIAPSGSLQNYFRIPYAQQSWDFSPNGKKVYYIKSYWPSETGSFLNDIFVLDRATKQETRLTKNARVYDVAASADNLTLAWIQYRGGVFSIVKSDCSGQNITPVIDGIMGEPFMGLSFDPKDPDKLVTSRIIQGKAALCIVDIMQKSLTRLSTSKAQEESPFWATNGRIYYSADYDGIYNIYSIKPSGTDCMRHCNVGTGVFSPFRVDSLHLLCSEYKGRAFTLANLSDAFATPYQVPGSGVCNFQNLPHPQGIVSITSDPYDPKLLRPVWDIQTSASILDKYGKLENIHNNDAMKNFADSIDYELTAGFFESQSDALEKRARWIGVQGAIQGQGKTKKDSVQLHSTAIFPKARIKQSQEMFFSPLVSNPGKKNNLLSHETLTAILETYTDYDKALHHSPAASNDSSSSARVLPLLVPGIGWNSVENAVSLGFTLQGIMLYGIIPAIISAGGSAQWQLQRNVYADFSPQLQYYTNSISTHRLYAIADLPLSLVWSFYGYANTDMQYNMADETMFGLTFDPAFFPITTIGPFDTTVTTGSGATYTVQCAHGFPVARYSSLVLSASANYSNYSDLILDPQDTLRGVSMDFSRANGAAAFIFPLARQINKGKRYADALYAELVYQISLYANRDLSNTMLGKALSNAQQSLADSGHIIVSHYLGAGINMGFTKSYTFSQTLSFMVLWDLWTKSMRLNLSFSM